MCAANVTQNEMGMEYIVQKISRMLGHPFNVSFHWFAAVQMKVINTYICFYLGYVCDKRRKKNAHSYKKLRTYKKYFYLADVERKFYFSNVFLIRI